MWNRVTSLAHEFQQARLPSTWKTLKKCDVLLVRHDNNCGYTYQAKAYAHLTDSLGDICVNKGLAVRSVATVFSKLIGNNAYNSPVSMSRSLFFINQIQRFIRRIKGRTYSIQFSDKRKTNLWLLILKKASPRCVIGIQPGVDLCKACKKKKIPVYELQHGVITDEHSWYGCKYRVSSNPIELPDGFLCWDEPSAAVLRKWAPQKGIDVRIIGNPWFDRFLSKDRKDFLVQEAISQGKIFINPKPTILVSLQWGLDSYYKHSGFNGVMVEALEKTILATADSYNWLLRLHPVQLQDGGKEKIDSYLRSKFGNLGSVEWHRCSELPLPLVLEQIAMHITDSSTVVVEAGWMGIYSGLLNNDISPSGIYSNYYAHELSLGLATVLPQDDSAIKHWIKETLSKGKGKSSLKNANKGLNRFIDEIVLSVETSH